MADDHTRQLYNDSGQVRLNLPRDLIAAMGWQAGDRLQILAAPGSRLILTRINAPRHTPAGKEVTP